MEYIIISLTTNVNTNVSACESIDISICEVDTFCHLSTLISSDLTLSSIGDFTSARLVYGRISSGAVNVRNGLWSAFVCRSSFDTNN